MVEACCSLYTVHGAHRSWRSNFRTFIITPLFFMSGFLLHLRARPPREASSYRTFFRLSYPPDCPAISSINFAASCFAFQMSGNVCRDTPRRVSLLCLQLPTTRIRIFVPFDSPRATC